MVVLRRSADVPRRWLQFTPRPATKKLLFITGNNLLICDVLGRNYRDLFLVPIFCWIDRPQAFSPPRSRQSEWLSDGRNACSWISFERKPWWNHRKSEYLSPGKVDILRCICVTNRRASVASDSLTRLQYGSGRIDGSDSSRQCAGHCDRHCSRIEWRAFGESTCGNSFVGDVLALTSINRKTGNNLPVLLASLYQISVQMNWSRHRCPVPCLQRLRPRHSMRLSRLQSVVSLRGRRRRMVNP